MIVSIPKWMITTSRWQGHSREGLSEGSLSANLRADGQKLHIRPISGDELAQDNEVHGSRIKVNAAVVQRKFMFLSGEICLTCGSSEQRLHQQWCG